MAEIMTIETIPTDVKIKDIKARLPEDIHTFATQFDKGGESFPREVWLVGPLMGDWFVKKEREDQRVFPLFQEHIPYDELKTWEVLEIYKEAAQRDLPQGSDQ